MLNALNFPVNGTKETARLYTLLSDKLGNDTTEAMFKYIDNKTERSVEIAFKH